MAFPSIYKEIAPDKHLRQFIKCYWKFEKTYAPGEFERVFPDSSYELIYGPDVTYTVQSIALPNLYFVGQFKKPLDFYAVGTVRHWAVRFYPWGLRPFGDVQKLVGREWLPADHILTRQDCQEFRHLPSTSHSDQDVVRALDEYFIKRLLSWQFDDALLRQILVELKAQKGRAKIKELADACYVSQRHLSRKIATATGQSPHEIASRLRFEHVRDAIMHNPDIPLAFLAGQYEYTDQSHLIKEFRAYTDMTPTAYAQLFRKAQPHMQDRSNVLFLQAD